MKLKSKIAAALMINLSACVPKYDTNRSSLEYTLIADELRSFLKGIDEQALSSYEALYKETHELRSKYNFLNPREKGLVCGILRNHSIKVKGILFLGLLTPLEIARDPEILEDYTATSAPDYNEWLKQKIHEVQMQELSPSRISRFIKFLKYIFSTFNQIVLGAIEFLYKIAKPARFFMYAYLVINLLFGNPPAYFSNNCGAKNFIWNQFI